jgi:predicted dehydrogenase
VEFENGLISHFTASRMAERKYRIMECIGTNEIYRIDLLNKQATCFTSRLAEQNAMEEAYLNRNMAVLEEKKLNVIDSNAIEEELKSFVDCIVNNKKVVVSLDDGTRAMQLAKEIEDQMNHRY